LKQVRGAVFKGGFGFYIPGKGLNGIHQRGLRDGRRLLVPRSSFGGSSSCRNSNDILRQASSFPLDLLTELGISMDAKLVHVSTLVGPMMDALKTINVESVMETNDKGVSGSLSLKRSIRTTTYCR
jgi:hypothetical protein